MTRRRTTAQGNPLLRFSCDTLIRARFAHPDYTVLCWDVAFTAYADESARFRGMRTRAEVHVGGFTRGRAGS